MKQRIQAFPTMRLFKDGEVFAPDYKQDRTVAALKEYSKAKVELEEKMKEWHPKRRERVQAQTRDHPGCMISGSLDVNRVPGNFHIEARSKSHNLNAAMTNLSHIVNHLSFGSPLLGNQKKRVKRFADYSSNFSPLDGNVYVTKEFHQAYHHFSKVVSTHYQINNMFKKLSTILGYQILAESQIMQYGEDEVPEAKFSYDLSPMAVVVSSKGRRYVRYSLPLSRSSYCLSPAAASLHISVGHTSMDDSSSFNFAPVSSDGRASCHRWYDFVTSLCAIIGGTFTLFGFLDTLVHKFMKADKAL